MRFDESRPHQRTHINNGPAEAPAKASLRNGKLREKKKREGNRKVRVRDPASRVGFRPPEFESLLISFRSFETHRFSPLVDFEFSENEGLGPSGRIGSRRLHHGSDDVVFVQPGFFPGDEERREKFAYGVGQG